MKIILDNDLSSLDNDKGNEEMKNLYLLAKDDIDVIILNKVLIKNPSYEKLYNVFEELYKEFEKLGIKYNYLKMKISYLTSKIDFFFLKKFLF